ARRRPLVLRFEADRRPPRGEGACRASDRRKPSPGRCWGWRLGSGTSGAPGEERVNLAEGTVVADRFRLVRELGQGGMGSVWFAHHTGLDIPCAVKFIHAEVAALPEIRARFEREAKAAAQLRSPNVVQVLDYGVCDGIPYIAMEFLEGEDLAARLKRM